jgi:hypothetical protein
MRSKKVRNQRYLNAYPSRITVWKQQIKQLFVINLYKLTL